MRHQWPRADVVETGLVTDPDCRGHHYVKWRNPFTGLFIEVWGATKTRAFRRAIYAWRLAMKAYVDAVEKALQ